MRKLLKRYHTLSIRVKIIGITLSALFLFGSICMISLLIVNQTNQKLLYNTLASSLSYSTMNLYDALHTLEEKHTGLTPTII